MIDDARQQAFDNAVARLFKWAFFSGMVVGAIITIVVVKYT